MLGATQGLIDVQETKQLVWRLQNEEITPVVNRVGAIEHDFHVLPWKAHSQLRLGVFNSHFHIERRLLAALSDYQNAAKKTFIDSVAE